MCKNKQPTEFCIDICTEKDCLYRYNIIDSLNDRYYHQQFVEIINKNGDDLWEKLNILCKEVVQQTILPEGLEESITKIALCYALQKSLSIKSFNRRHVEMIMKNLIALNKSQFNQNGEQSVE